MRMQHDETTAMIAKEVQNLVRAELADAAMKWNEGHGSAADALPKLGGMGLLGILASETDGGSELDDNVLAVVLEQLAIADAGLAALVAGHNIALAAGLRAGFGVSDASRDAMRACAGGDALLCWIDGRADGHLDNDSPAFELREGRLYGAVPSVIGAPTARYAITTVEQQSEFRIALVDLQGEGVDRNATAAERELVGLRSADAGPIRFDGAPVLADARKTGAQALGRTRARLAMAAILCGSARAAHEAGVRYTLERVQFGKPIAAFQPMQWQTADSTTELTGAQLLLGRAAASLVAATAEASDHIDRAVVAAFETARRVSDRALQMHGGYGYTTDYAVERPYRDAYALPLLGGTALAARARIAARLADAA